MYITYGNSFAYSAGYLFTGPTYTKVVRISKKGGEIRRNAVRGPGPAAPRLEMDCSGPVTTLLGPCSAIPAHMSYRGCLGILLRWGLVE